MKKSSPYGQEVGGKGMAGESINQHSISKKFPESR